MTMLLYSPGTLLMDDSDPLSDHTGPERKEKGNRELLATGTE